MRAATRELLTRRRVLAMLAAWAALAPIVALGRDTAAAAYRAGQALCMEVVAAVAGLGVHPAAALVALLALITLVPAVIVGARQLTATLRVTGFVQGRAVPVVPEPLDRLTMVLGLTGRVRLVDVPGPLAFCFGWIRPQICVSTALVDELSPAELEAVLRHEARHLRRRDPLRVLALNAADAGLFAVPVLRQLLQFYLLRQELAADAAAVRAMNDAYPLASALYKVLTSPTTPDPQGTSSAFAAIDVRIDHLLGVSGAPSLTPRVRSHAAVQTALGGAVYVFLLCLIVAALQHPWPGNVCPAC